jgi:hypothetical protein
VIKLPKVLASTVIDETVKHYNEHKHLEYWAMEDSFVHVLENHDIGYDLNDSQFKTYVKVCTDLHDEYI